MVPKPKKFCQCSTKPKCECFYRFRFKHRGEPYTGSTKTTDYDLACAIVLEEYEKVVARKANVAKRGQPKITAKLSELRTKYERWLVGAQPSCVERSKYALDSFQASFKPRDPRLIDITPDDFEEWRLRRLTEGVCRDTVQTEFLTLKAMFRQSEEWYPGYGRPEATVRCWKLDEKTVVYPNEAEVRRALLELPSLYALMVRVTVETLARISEILRLKRSDVGPDWIQRRLKGGKVLKAKISPALAKLLHAQFSRKGQEFLIETNRKQRPHPRRKTPYFGPGLHWRPLQQKETSANFCRYFNQMGLALSHHKFRHYGITVMLERGISSRVIEALAGWTSGVMLKRYGHARDAEMLRAVCGNADLVEAILNAPAAEEQQQKSA
jgi:integrase